jgi:hypothetical protein
LYDTLLWHKQSIELLRLLLCCLASKWWKRKKKRTVGHEQRQTGSKSG